MTTRTAPQETPVVDLELLPPLEPLEKDASLRNHSFLHPLLCRMFVACNVLKLSNETRFTSLVLLHRYYSSLSNNNTKVDWKYVAAACLFLGTKTEEETRRLRDVLNVADMLEFDTPLPSPSNENSSLETIKVKQKPMLLNDNYWKAKERLIATEQCVLRMLQFDVCVSHPHRAAAVLLSQEDFENKQELLPESWKWLNQALFHAPALSFDVLTMASASIECAQTTLNNEGGGNINGIPWWYKYGVSYNALQTCKMQLEKATTVYPINR